MRWALIEKNGPERPNTILMMNRKGEEKGEKQNPRYRNVGGGGVILQLEVCKGGGIIAESCVIEHWSIIKRRFSMAVAVPGVSAASLVYGVGMRSMRIVQVKSTGG